MTNKKIINKVDKMIDLAYKLEWIDKKDKRNYSRIEKELIDMFGKNYEKSINKLIAKMKKELKEQ
jgi:uncharacterized protein YlaN (UPF0358 family)